MIRIGEERELSPVALDNGQRSPRKLLAAVVMGLPYALRRSRSASPG
jgi:hypothetical protein